MKTIKYLLLSLFVMVGLVAQAQQVEVTRTNGDTEVFEVDSVVYLPDYSKIYGITLSANGTDLSGAGTSYSMTYNPNNQPSVSRVYEKNSDKTLTEGTDYVITNPTDFNAGEKQFVVRFKGKYQGEIRIDLSINKAPGYFTNRTDVVDGKDELPFSGTGYVDDYYVLNGVLTLDAVPVVDTDGITYKWYRSSSPLGLTSGGSLQSAETTNSITLKYAKYYWRVEVYVPATQNYTEYTGYAYMQTLPEKPVFEGFKFVTAKDSSPLSVGTYNVPELVKASNSGTVTYSIESGGEFGSVNSSTGVITLNAVGTVVVKATISGSSTHEYVPNTALFTLDIVDEAPCYWGYERYWDWSIKESYTDRERFEDSLKAGKLPDTKYVAEMNGNTFDVDGPKWIADGMPIPCSVWWYAVPTNIRVVSALEYGTSNVNYEAFRVKMNDVFGDSDMSYFTVNIGGTDYYVYASNNRSSTAFVSTTSPNHFIRVTIQ